MLVGIIVVLDADGILVSYFIWFEYWGNICWLRCIKRTALSKSEEQATRKYEDEKMWRDLDTTKKKKLNINDGDGGRRSSSGNCMRKAVLVLRVRCSPVPRLSCNVYAIHSQSMVLLNICVVICLLFLRSALKLCCVFGMIHTTLVHIGLSICWCVRVCMSHANVCSARYAIFSMYWYVTK